MTLCVEWIENVYGTMGNDNEMDVFRYNRSLHSITEPSDISSHEVMTQSDETSFLPQFSKFSQNSDRTLRVT